MLIADICIADCNVVAVKRIEVYSVRSGNIHSIGGKTSIRLCDATYLVPVFSTICCFHHPVPIGDNGVIAILDQYTNVKGSLFAKGVASLLGWNLFAFAGGRAYDFDVVKQWLEEEGFHSISLTPLRQSPGFSFIKAQKSQFYWLHLFPLLM